MKFLSLKKNMLWVLLATFGFSLSMYQNAPAAQASDPKKVDPQKLIEELGRGAKSLKDALNDFTDDAYAQIEIVLFACIKDRSNKQPFYYFVDLLIEIISNGQQQLKSRMNKSMLDKFLIDLARVRDIKNVQTISLTLLKYRTLLPASLQKVKPAEFIKALHYRVNLPG